MMLLHKENVFIDVEVNNPDELFEKIGRHMVNGGFAKDSFIQALKDRERAYPTGLPSGASGIALPHVDACHVLVPSVAVARLKKPVQFIMMGSDDTFVNVGVVFMLLLESGHSQVEMLKKLMGIIQDSEFLERLMNCAASDELFEMLKDLI